MKEGKLICVEGADGVGKSTQVELLAERLKGMGAIVETIHFPKYDSPSSFAVRTYLEGEYKAGGNPYAIAVHYINDFIYVWHTRIRPALDEGKYVILDRFFYSTLVYEGAMLDTSEERDKLWNMVAETLNLSDVECPDVTVYLDAPLEYCLENKMKLLKEQNKNPDVHEKSEELLRRVHKRADTLQEFEEVRFVDCVKDGKLLSKEAISDEVMSVVMRTIAD